MSGPEGWIAAAADWSDDRFAALQDLVFQGVVSPILYDLGFAHRLEEAYTATGAALAAAVGLVALRLLLIPLERLWPVEARGPARAVAADVAYTLIHRLGFFGLLVFALTDPAEIALQRAALAFGFDGGTLTDAVPWLRETPAAALAVCLVATDFTLYWIHRAQHASAVWWSLHALHHSQRHMTMWTDDRQHLLDSLVIALVLIAVGTIVGTPPASYAWVGVLTGLVEGLSHANLRLDFGPVGGRLLVSPRYHRTHHALVEPGPGPGPGPRLPRYSNFATLFPVWDWLFGTADFRRDDYRPTGIVNDPFGDGLIRQQIAGLRQLARALARKIGGARKASAMTLPNA